MRLAFLLLLADVCAGALWAEMTTIGGVDYYNVYHADGEYTELVADIPDHQGWPRTPGQDPAPPRPTDAEAASRLVAYVCEDPGQHRPYHVPTDKERVSVLSAFLTPGEERAAWFGLYALEELRGLAVTVETGDAPLSVDVRNSPNQNQARAAGATNGGGVLFLLLRGGVTRAGLPRRRGWRAQ